MPQQLTIDTECSECEGTGVYRGRCELDGQAVLCRICKGSGKHTISYKPFTGRKTREDVRVVFPVQHQTDPKIGIHQGDFIDYADFLTGEMPRHIAAD